MQIVPSVQSASTPTANVTPVSESESVVVLSSEPLIVVVFAPESWPPRTSNVPIVRLRVPLRMALLERMITLSSVVAGAVPLIVSVPLVMSTVAGSTVAPSGIVVVPPGMRSVPAPSIPPAALSGRSALGASSAPAAIFHSPACVSGDEPLQLERAALDVDEPVVVEVDVDAARPAGEVERAGRRHAERAGGAGAELEVVGRRRGVQGVHEAPCAAGVHADRAVGPVSVDADPRARPRSARASRSWSCRTSR